MSDFLRKESSDLTCEVSVTSHGQVAMLGELTDEFLSIVAIQSEPGSRWLHNVTTRAGGILVDIIGAKDRSGSIRWIVSTTEKNTKVSSHWVKGWEFTQLPPLRPVLGQRRKAGVINDFFGEEVCTFLPEVPKKVAEAAKPSAEPAQKVHPKKESSGASTRAFVKTRSRDEAHKKHVVKKPVHNTPAPKKPASAAPQLPDTQAAFRHMEFIASLSEKLAPLGIYVQMDLEGNPVVSYDAMLRRINDALAKVGVELLITPDGHPVAVTKDQLVH